MGEKKIVGLALCGSYCSYDKVFAAAGVLAISTNDGLSGSAENIARLLNRKNVYFVPFGQDDPAKKPCSLQADFSLMYASVEAAMAGAQLQPILTAK